MENKDSIQSGYQIINIFLMESYFKRESQVTFDFEKIKPSIDLNVNTNTDNDKIIVTETLKYESIFNGIKEVSAQITMVGVFEKVGESQSVSVTDFGKINASAIIYPFIREHLSSLSLKSGIGHLLIPPANFTKKSD